MKKTTIGTIATLLLSGMTLPAAIIIEDGLGSLPSLDFQTYTDWASNSTTRMGSKENRDNTQSFVLPSAIDVDSFFLSVNSATEGKTVTFRLFEVTSSPTAGSLTLGSQLAFEAYTFSAADATATFDGGATNGDNLLTWDVTSLTLSAGSYALQIEDDGDTTLSIGWRSNVTGSGNGIYTPGAAYRNGGATLDLRNGEDLTLGIVAIPEPSTLALTLVCGLTVAGMVRRRKN